GMAGGLRPGRARHKEHPVMPEAEPQARLSGTSRNEAKPGSRRPGSKRCSRNRSHGFVREDGRISFRRDDGWISFGPRTNRASWSLAIRREPCSMSDPDTQVRTAPRVFSLE